MFLTCPISKLGDNNLTGLKKKRARTVVRIEDSSSGLGTTNRYMSAPAVESELSIYCMPGCLVQFAFYIQMPSK